MISVITTLKDADADLNTSNGWSKYFKDIFLSLSLNEMNTDLNRKNTKGTRKWQSIGGIVGICHILLACLGEMEAGEGVEVRKQQGWWEIVGTGELGREDQVARTKGKGVTAGSMWKGGKVWWHLVDEKRVARKIRQCRFTSTSFKV